MPTNPLPPSLVTCPVCRRKFDTQASPAMPFCSKRCRSIDLGRWLGEQYGVPAPRTVDDDEMSSAGDE